MLLVIIAACGEPDRRSIGLLPRCVEGRSESCTCADGRSGAQICGSDRTFGPCMCEGPIPPRDSGAHEDARVEPSDSGDPIEERDADFDAGTHSTDNDTGVPDNGVPDFGVPDFGVPDFGVPDFGVVFPDAAMPQPDAGRPDARPADSGPRDASTTGQFCFFDAMCSPPNTICEMQMCVASCLVAGCQNGQVCNVNDGRCVPACMTDLQCMAPDTVCENGGCYPGCTSFGGPTCSSPQVCNTSTGRCGPCTTDTQCGAPAEICVSGSCVPGCAEPGGAACTGTNVCQHDTGRCEAPGTLALGASCTRHNDCASSYCHAYGGGSSKWCVSACGTNRDCAAGFSCVDDFGAHMCIAAARAGGGATFTDAAGANCASNGECQSNLCAASACVDSCAEDSDCVTGSCRWYSPVMNDYDAACNGPLGMAANGAACTTNGDCRSGVCEASTCAELCSTTADCDANRICQPVDDSVCLQELFPGFCIQYELNIVTACVIGARGAGGVGAPCMDASACQSGICHVGLGRCTDTCSRNSDCPTADRCKSAAFSSTGVQGFDANVCVPRGF